MNSILRCVLILTLLVSVFPMIVYADSSNVTTAPPNTVTASSDWVIVPASVAYAQSSISSFFTCVFGVRIFPGADPVGVYAIHDNSSYVPDTRPGMVNGHMFIGSVGRPLPGMIFYLKDKDNSASGLYYAITDNHGYYEIDHVPFGHYDVYTCNDEGSMRAGNGNFVKTITLTTSDPSAVVDSLLTFG